ncbi:hypothetical protein [Nonomuraea sp. NPDC049709]|uniref:hypothetical protein n=1 Tax=Nonomuraea sp. NPDC049709 TaxID=3154736 RepID=UPI003446D1B6
MVSTDFNDPDDHGRTYRHGYPPTKGFPQGNGWFTVTTGHYPNRRWRARYVNSPSDYSKWTGVIP